MPIVQDVVQYTLLPSTAYTTAKTVVGDWVDLGPRTELVGWLNVTAFAARANETLDVVIERWSGTTLGYTTVLSFTQIATTGAHTEEKTAVSLIGTRVRYRATTAGTWSTKSITFDIGIQAK